PLAAETVSADARATSAEKVTTHGGSRDISLLKRSVWPSNLKGSTSCSIPYYHADMRGDDQQPDSMFSYVSPEQRVPKDHPLRAIRQLVDEILHELSLDFDRLYAKVGRPSIPLERLLRAQLLQIFYSIRSERLLMEQLDYNILFRW